MKGASCMKEGIDKIVYIIDSDGEKHTKEEEGEPA